MFSDLERFVAAHRPCGKLVGHMGALTERTKPRLTAILKDKVRNVSNQPEKDILVVWMLYGPDEQPFNVQSRAGGPSVFIDRIDYLDSKAEADFNISLDLYGDLSTSSADDVLRAIGAGRHEAGLYVKATSE